MDERDFFDERPEKKPATLNCPHCHQASEYEVTWLVRTKKRPACWACGRTRPCPLC